jgi:co-chaperonin GroES (HSP10)
MKPLKDFIVYVPERVNETKKIGDIEIYIDTKFNEFEHRVMHGEVMGVPQKYKTDVEVGDTLFFHHHVVITPQVVDEKHHLYQVLFDPNGGFSSQAYAVKKKNTGEVIALGDWVFLEPIRPEAKLKSDLLEIVSYDTPRNEKGKIKYASDKIKEHGLEVGDTVFFQKDADYEMLIDNQTLWRMLVQHLMVVEK